MLTTPIWSLYIHIELSSYSLQICTITMAILKPKSYTAAIPFPYTAKIILQSELSILTLC